MNDMLAIEVVGFIFPYKVSNTGECWYLIDILKSHLTNNLNPIDLNKLLKNQIKWEESYCSCSKEKYNIPFVTEFGLYTLIEKIYNNVIKKKEKLLWAKLLKLIVFKFPCSLSHAFMDFKIINNLKELENYLNFNDLSLN